MSRPDSRHVEALKAFRQRLVEARRAAARDEDLNNALARFTAIATAIDLVDRAIDDERDLTPLPGVDDPTEPAPFPNDKPGPPVIERL